jgi:hypothetical protein
MRPLVLSVSLVSVALFGCGSEATCASECFLASAKDFADFEKWESFTLTDPGPSEIHQPTPRTIYINKRPPVGSGSFPVGTVIVKVMPADTFAMVKRGNDYNLDGAKDWEWFDLVKSAGGQTVIKWRGLGPPVGEKYNKSDQTCNGCHKGGVANDFVLSQNLKL